MSSFFAVFGGAGEGDTSASVSTSLAARWRARKCVLGWGDLSLARGVWRRSKKSWCSSIRIHYHYVFTSTISQTSDINPRFQREKLNYIALLVPPTESSRPKSSPLTSLSTASGVSTEGRDRLPLPRPPRPSSRQHESGSGAGPVRLPAPEPRQGELPRSGRTFPLAISTLLPTPRGPVCGFAARPSSRTH